LIDSTPKNSFDKLLIFDKNNFSDWNHLNDTIMGGKSEAQCRVTSQGLLLEGNLVEDGGGFVSCRSPVLSPPINLSNYVGLELVLEGYGRTFKFGASSEVKNLLFSRFIPFGLKWIISFPTESNGTTVIKIPFSSLEPVIRAKPVRLPVSFNSSSITQFQLLYSKFGKPGKMNTSFQEGPLRVLIKSINAYK